MVWQAVVERFEQQAPASAMARLALEQALPAHWIDEVFETHRQRQYPRELLFSTVVELMTLVSLGLRPSLHAAARKLDERLAVSLTALYDKVNRCEPAVLCALVQGSAQRLAPLAACLPMQASLPGQATAHSGRQPLARQRQEAGRAARLSRRRTPGPHAGGLRPGQCTGVRHRGV
jgi:IS4 transposase